MSNNLPPYLIISQDIHADIMAAIDSIQPDKIGLLVDENTHKHCLAALGFNTDLIIEIESGESNKTLQTCEYIWNQMTEAGFTRKSLFINLGGGVIGDMGGFAAATYKRGMPFINIPTTLLSQVDASIGGKLGVDFHGLKNHIGIFQEPSRVIVHTAFLKTLPERELKSGFAEIIKHSLIRSEPQWEYLLAHPFDGLDWDELIPKSITIKNEVVEEDPREHGVRKILNYGHTIGHAMESHFLASSKPLLHGEAVALGMILENELAVSMGMLERSAAERIRNYLEGVYDLPVDLPGYDVLTSFLKQDKKNDAQGIRFSLLEKEGYCTFDVQVEESLLKQVLK